MTPRVINLADIGKFVFHCGPEGRYFAVVIPLLQSYLDESSDEKKEHVFCVGAFLANEVHWKKLQDAWLERLKVPDDIPYFRASSCKGVHDPFFKLRKKYGPDAQSVADKIRADLEHILLSHPWIGFGIGILVPDYREVWATAPEAKKFYLEDPVESAFGSMFYTVARAMRKRAPDYQVAFVTDDSTYSGKIAEMYKAVKKNHPVLAKSMATFVPLDDKITPPLQMADLIASIVKDVFLEWLENGKPQHVPLEVKWHDHFEVIGKWDKNYMLQNIRATLKSKRFKNGQLAERLAPKSGTGNVKQEQKRMRKELIRNFKSKNAGAGTASEHSGFSWNFDEPKVS